jgi:outer membrane protein TolC
MLRHIGPVFLAIIASTFLGGCLVTPKPYTTSEFEQKAAADLVKLSADQEPITKPVDLYEAMARALKYNLNYRVEAARTKLRMAELNLSHYSMLPTVVANAGADARNNTLASSSFNLVTNTPNFGASTSQDQRLRSADLAFSWNILDFGLSYVRAHQSADRVLISEEMQRKITHRLLEDVRDAYWRAVSYDRLAKRLKRLEARTKKALANSRSLSKSRQTSQASALVREIELVEIKQEIKYLEREIFVAKSQLAALMSVKPGIAFDLVVRNRPPSQTKLPLKLDEMIAIAVRDRAELRENRYQQRINMNEARAALLDLLPGLELYAGPNWESNSFLLNSDWVSWGAKASWNLLKVFQLPAKRKAIESQNNVLETQALALAMAIMTQVHVSRIQFDHSRQVLAAAAEYRSVRSRYVQQIRIEAEANRVSEQVLLREEMNALVAEAEYDIAYASLQSAYASVFASMGWDFHGNIDRSLPVAAIAAPLREAWLNLDGMKASVNLAYSKVR